MRISDLKITPLPGPTLPSTGETPFHLTDPNADYYSPRCRSHDGSKFPMSQRGRQGQGQFCGLLKMGFFDSIFLAISGRQAVSLWRKVIGLCRNGSAAPKSHSYHRLCRAGWGSCPQIRTNPDLSLWRDFHSR